MKKLITIITIAVTMGIFTGCTTEQTDLTEMQTQIEDLTTRLEKAEELLALQDDVNTSMFKSVEAIIDVIELMQ